MAQGLQLRKAKRSQVFVKVGIASPSGGGKTAGSLFIAYGMVKEQHPDWTDEQVWDKIVLIDSENGSGELYANHTIDGNRIGEYAVITLAAPFTAEKYIAAIDLAEKNDFLVCIIDSTSHLWTGEGGLLEQQSEAAKKTGNSYTAWRDVTPDHNRFVEKMLQTKMHLIATIRSKTEHVQEKDEKGKVTVKKIGLQPVQRAGMEYEFTLFLDLDELHKANVSKDRTSLFDRKTFRITPETGSKLMAWVLSGDTSVAKVLDTLEVKDANPEDGAKKNKARIKQLFTDATPEAQEKYKEIFRKYEPVEGDPNKVKDVEKQSAMLSEMEQVALEK